MVQGKVANPQVQEPGLLEHACTAILFSLLVVPCMYIQEPDTSLEVPDTK